MVSAYRLCAAYWAAAWVAGSTVAVVAISAFAVYHEVPPADRTCRIEARRLGALFGDREQRAVLGAFLASAQPNAAAAFARFDGALARPLHTWVATRVGVCEDATAGTPAAARLVRAQTCLDADRDRARALIERASRPGSDPDALSREAAALSDPADCVRTAR